MKESKILKLIESYEKNISIAEDCGITAEELWNTLYKPWLVKYMNEE